MGTPRVVRRPRPVLASVFPLLTRFFPSFFPILDAYGTLVVARVTQSPSKAQYSSFPGQTAAQWYFLKHQHGTSCLQNLQR